MARVPVQFRGRGELDDLAEVHDRDAVAHVLHDAEVVGDEEVGEPEVALQFQQQVEHLGLHRDIEGGDGFVADDELGLEREGAGDADALTLATGKLEGVAAQRVGGQADPAQQFGGPFAAFGAAAEVLDDEGFLEDLADRVAAVEGFGGVLEDHLHFPAQGAQGARPGVGEVAAFELDAAAGRAQQAHHRAREGGLAAAALTDEAEGFALLEVETDAVDRLAHRLGGAEDTAADGVMHFQVLDAEQGHRSEVVFCQPGLFHQGFQEADFQRLIAVDGKSEDAIDALLDEYVVATLDAVQLPTLGLCGFEEGFAADLFHTASARMEDWASS